jgi:hypothetical protein
MVDEPENGPSLANSPLLGRSSSVGGFVISKKL